MLNRKARRKGIPSPLRTPQNGSGLVVPTASRAPRYLPARLVPTANRASLKNHTVLNRARMSGLYLTPFDAKKDHDDNDDNDEDYGASAFHILGIFPLAGLLVELERHPEDPSGLRCA